MEKYKQEVIKALKDFKFDKEIPTILKDTNSTIFVAGNGGSAAIASHYVLDFSKGPDQDWSSDFKRYKAICLSSNIGYVTAISNDSHYKEIFKQQLMNLASKDDILILISSSGNSPNILEAAKYAREIGMIVIGITGFTGGQLKEIANYNAHVDSDSYEICEDVHSIFGHYLANYLRK